jgi:hypothetical protein
MCTKTEYDVVYVNGADSMVVGTSPDKVETQTTYDKMCGFSHDTNEIKIIKRSVTTKLTDVTKQYV